MADNTGTTDTQRSTNAQAASTRRSTAATKRSTAAKKAAQTRAARSGAASRKRTTTAAKSRTTSAQRTQRSVSRETNTVQALAERAVLTYVGAALVARDNVIGRVEDLRTKYGTPQKAERRIETQLRKFERRGATARRSLEREVKRTRTRMERELRQRRVRFERQVRPVVRDVQSQGNLTSAQAENLGAQLQHAVQSGLTASTELAAKFQKRFAELV